MKLARVVLVVALAACGGSPAPAPLANKGTEPAPAPPRPALDSPTQTVAEAIERMGQFRDAMCVCTDQACVDGLTDQMTRWGEAMAKQETAPQVSDGEAKQMAGVVEELTQCMTKIMTAAAQKRTDNAAPADPP